MRTILLIIFLCITGNIFAVPLQNSNTKADSNILKKEVFNPYEATQKYLSILTPAEKKKSDSYYEGKYWLILWNMVYEVLVAWIFLSLGLSRWIKKLVLKVKRINLQNLIYIGCYIIFVFLLSLPINIYENFIREHKYNLSNLTFGNWFGEEIISLSLELVLGCIAIMLLYIALRKVKQNWWIWGGIISIIFMVFISFIAPVFISPLYNKYKPLAEGNLKKEILSLTRANGIPCNEVYQYDASKQTTAISANVSGFGSTIGISLNDNLLNKCTNSEIKSVMAHEMGHYVLNHVYKSIFFLGLVILLGFIFVNWSFNKIINSWGRRWQITDLSDISGLPLFIVLFSLFMFIVTPVNNNIIRTDEIEADMFGLNAAREPDGFASVSMKLSTYRKINPGYWEEIIFYDHPSGKTRVLSAMKWKAEHLDESKPCP
jgi:STE24 endopeptidase